jgi:hypothetical protein
LNSIYKREPKYLLYRESHVTKNYFCSIYKKKDKKCLYIITKYSNYLSTTHLASSKLYEVYLVIKQATITIIPIITINK